MINRAIRSDPDKTLANFDYFNDYQDTLDWLSGQGGRGLAGRSCQLGLLKRLEEGRDRYVRLQNATPEERRQEKIRKFAEKVLDELRYQVADRRSASALPELEAEAIRLGIIEELPSHG